MFIFRIILFIIPAIVAIKLFFFAIGVFTLMVGRPTGVLIVIAFAYVCVLLMKGNLSGKTPETQAQPQSVESFSAMQFCSRINRACYRSQKSMTPLPVLSNYRTAKASKWSKKPKNVVRVKILSGDHKGDLAWVSKSDVSRHKSKI